MKRILFLAAAAIAICVSNTTTYVQSESLKLHFHVPFSFAVENATFVVGDSRSIKGKLLHKVAPDYPEKARHLGIERTVVMCAKIGKRRQDHEP